MAKEEETKKHENEKTDERKVLETEAIDRELAEQEEQGEMVEELEDITFTPGWMVVSFFLFLDEIFDIVSLFLDLTGVWLVVSYVISFIPLLIFIGWRVAEEGFSPSAIIGSSKQLLFLVLEFIPGIEDIWPGWALTMLDLRKKKVTKKVIKRK